MAPNKKKGDDEPEKDPYDVLNIPFSASEAEVTKGYRKLALKFHPDKQKGNLNETQLAAIADKFQEIQAARDFLLDNEKRRKYDAKRASIAARKVAEEVREQQMSNKRKHMREQLFRQEQEAASSSAPSFSPSKKRKSAADTAAAAKVEKLRRQGAEMRDNYASRAQQQQQEAKARKDASAAASQKSATPREDRQVRLKWSRKKMKLSPSEHDISKMMQKFGEVQNVEMLGSKGNAALVTFEHSDSCAPCVQAYLESEEMRASYVGSRKEEEIRKKQRQEEQEAEALRTKSQSASTTNNKQSESVEEYKLRRAAEREKLLREMEQQEGGTENQKHVSDETVRANHPTPRSTEPTQPFPPEFPATDKFQALATPYEKLLLAEEQIFSRIESSA